MGYFSNGMSVSIYTEQYCDRCVHGQIEDDFGCPVLGAHLDASPDKMSRRKSILHTFIPRDEDGQNGQCNMFVPLPTAASPETAPNQTADTDTHLT